MTPNRIKKTINAIILSVLFVLCLITPYISYLSKNERVPLGLAFYLLFFGFVCVNYSILAEKLIRTGSWNLIVLSNVQIKSLGFLFFCLSIFFAVLFIRTF